MSRGVVLTAGLPENNSAAATGIAAEATDSNGKCILLYALLAVKTPRYPSSRETGDRFIALTATPSRGGRDNWKQLASVPRIALKG